ncbi:hypothetical protein D3C78_1372540 [compost metagenome]
MYLDNAFRYGQTETCTPCLLRPRAIHPVKAVENKGQIHFWNGVSIILDTHDQHISILCNIDIDKFARLPVLDGIGDYILVRPY